MTEEEREDYLKYIENYTINDLADIFNTQNFVIQDKDKFNEILLYYHFKQNEEIEQLQQENQSLKKENKILRENAEHNDKVVDRVDWENQKLKKQLEEANEKILLLQASEPMLEYKKALEENQQKEFIDWLTNEININPYDISDYTYEDIINVILSKYKEIIDVNE